MRSIDVRSAKTPMGAAVRFGFATERRVQAQLADVALMVSAGKRHGLTHGVAHGMQSTPKIGNNNGMFTVSGVYFHILEAWDLETTAKERGTLGTGDFQLLCCGK
jgi:hypothetical protein